MVAGAQRRDAVSRLARTESSPSVCALRRGRGAWGRWRLEIPSRWERQSSDSESESCRGCAFLRESDNPSVRGQDKFKSAPGASVCLLALKGKSLKIFNQPQPWREQKSRKK
jgi:hypothetical protein